MANAGAELPSALSLSPAPAAGWEVSGSLCVLVACSGQGGKGRVWAGTVGDTDVTNGEAHLKVSESELCPVLAAITWSLLWP